MFRHLLTMHNTWMVVWRFLNRFPSSTHEGLGHLRPVVTRSIIRWKKLYISDPILKQYSIFYESTGFYLMGRSRTIGADSEIAGPPGGPEVRSTIVWKYARWCVSCTWGRASRGSACSYGNAVRRLMGGGGVGLLHWQVSVVTGPV